MTPAVPAALRGPVVIDTGVFASELVRSTALAELYAPDLEGRRYVVSFVTVAEVRFGARVAGWGTPRLNRLEQRIASARTVWPGPDLVEVYANLRTECVRRGHALGQKDHEADRWVAATALWFGIPLVHHDGIFENVPNLRTITHLPGTTS